MELIVERDALLSALNKVRSVAASNAVTIPILKHVCLTASGETLEIRATDTETQAAITCAAQVASAGATTVPASKISDLVRSLAVGAQVSLKLDSGRLAVRSGRSRLQLPTLPATDYPPFPVAEGRTHTTTIGAATLAQLLDRAAFAMGGDTARYYICGIFLHPIIVAGRAMLRAVATDGSRLAYAETECPEAWRDASAITIPRKAVGEVRRLLEGCKGDVVIWASDQRFGVEVGSVRLATALIAAAYPDYQRVVPAAGGHVLKLDVEETKTALKRCLIITSEQTRPVRLAISAGAMTLRARDLEGGAIEEAVDVDYAGPEVELSFNAAFLTEAIDMMAGEEAWLEIVGGPADPVRIVDPRAENALQILMPLRV